MINLAEIMQAAQGGNAYSNLANQFGIAPEQAEQAVQALLPAISMGLQHQTQTMDGWQNILGSLSQAKNSAEFFDSDGDGIPDHLENEGQNALGAMFGTPDVSEAVATNAAHFAGLPSGLIQQMLPVIASMVMGGLFKGASNSGLGGLLGQMMQGGAQGGQGGLGGILGSVLGQAMAPQQQSQQGGMGSQGGMGGMLGNILGSVLGGGRQQQAPQAGMGGGLGGLLGSLLGGGQPAAPQPASPADPVSAGLDALKGMFDTGQQVQSTQMDSLQQIFSQLGQRR